MGGRLAISAFWFFALGGLGVFFPFYSLYLRENAGLSGTQIGVVLAVLPLVAILAQPVWGQLADLTGSRARVLALLAFGAAAGYAALSLGGSFAQILVLTAFLACFSTSLIPTAVSVTFALCRDAGPAAFGLCRVWGTLGFGVCVVGFPYLLDVLDALPAVVADGGLLEPVSQPASEPASEPGLGAMFPVTAALVLVAAVIALAVPRGGALGARALRGDWRRLFAHPPYVRLLVVALGGYALLQGPMGIFPIFVRAHGGSLDTVSQLWILMLVLEVPLIAFSGASLERIGARGLLAVGLAAGALRWTVCGFFPESGLVFPIQILHGVVVAGLVIGGPLYVEAVVPEELRSTGQNVLAMVGMSFGGLLSNLGAGGLLEAFGPDAPYQVGGVGALLLTAALPFILPPPSRAGE